MAKQTNKRPAGQPVAPRPAPQPAAPVKKQPAAVGDMFSTRNLCIILGVLAFLLYANTLRNGWALDDVMVLKDNTMVAQGAKAIPELLTTPHMRGYLVIPNDLYRPLSLVMFALEVQFFGMNPAVHHFFNVLTFAGCVIMLFLFLDKFFDRKRTLVAFIAAAIFAVHPLHTEVVANIKSRDELMCFFFGFWALNLYMNYMKSGKMLQLLLGTVAMYLSFISKETVIAFLGLVPLIFFLYSNQDKKRALFITASTFIAFAIFFGIRTSVLSAYNANQPGAGVEFIDNALSKAPGALSKFATEVVVMGKYLKLMFAPYPLLCTYSYNSIPFADLSSIGFWVSLLAYGAMIYMAIKLFMKDRKNPWTFAVIFFLATIFLFSNFPFLMGAELAERFAFFASVGVCLAGALAIEKWVIKSEGAPVTEIRSTKVMGVLVVVCLLFGGMTFARNMDWKDDYTLFSTDVQKSPNDCRLYHNMATARAENMYNLETDTVKKKEMDAQSIADLRKALEIFPDYADAHVEMGRIFDRLRMPDSALKHDARALQLNPENATANNNMGSVYLETARYKEAIGMFKKSAALNANFKYPYVNMGRAYQQLKQYDSAIINYRTALALDPGYTDLWQEIGTNFFMMQRYDSAEVYFKKVLTINANEPNAINNLGAIYLNQQKYGQAAEYFKKAVALNPNYINAYSNLGRAYYFGGQYQAAIDMFNKEIQLDQKNGIRDIPYIALSYQKMGNMTEARKYEAIGKQIYSNFKLD